MSLVVDVPIAQLATTLAPLRGARTDAGSVLAPLPLRVAPAADGTYEVLDDFKRLAHWLRAGHTHLPVVVEDAGGVVGKARLLEANAPRSTVSPMDEARVVRSLADDDHLTPTQITTLLGRGRGWVDRRLVLGRRPAPDLARHVDDGRLAFGNDDHAGQIAVVIQQAMQLDRPLGAPELDLSAGRGRAPWRRPRRRHRSASGPCVKPSRHHARTRIPPRLHLLLPHRP